MGKSSLQKHAATSSHQKRTKSISTKQPTLFESTKNFNLNSKVIEADIKYAILISEHNLSFQLMDHLSGCVSSICSDSQIAKKVKCSRKKVTAIIKNVVGTYYNDEICEILQKNKFSLIVDESTDISLNKTLCLVVRVASKELKICDFVFDLISVEKADATSLFKKITNCFEKGNIDFRKNLIGFAADAANVMMGRNHSVASLLNQEVENLFILKCVCHLFHLCASYACGKLPNSVGYLARDVYNYLKSSKGLNP